MKKYLPCISEIEELKWEEKKEIGANLFFDITGTLRYKKQCLNHESKLFMTVHA